MLSVFLTFLIFIPFFNFEIGKKSEIDYSHYIIFASAITTAYAFLGLISLILIFLKLTFIPIYSILIFSISLLILKTSFRNSISRFFYSFYQDFQHILNSQKYRKTKSFFFVLLLILFLVSIGPINHSDTANIYVGYPYQFWIKNKHFIDGNLNQGLLGLGDFVNLFYFQDKSTWLIRSSQFIPLFVAFLIMTKKNISNILIFIFLTTPVLIQWLTVGKNNFLAETCLAIAFIAWFKNKEEKFVKNLVQIILISISFKISALLVGFPIIMYLIFHYRNNLLLDANFVLKLFKSLSFLISIFSLLSILIYRYHLYQNPFFPLFSNFFNNGNIQFYDWEITLKNWDRNGFFPLWIFIPKSLGKISFVLGPANLFLFIICAFNILKKKFENKSLISIGLIQTLFLLLFCQGRADYYSSPLIILISSFENNSFYANLFPLKRKIQFFQKYLSPLFFVSQVIIFLISITYTLALLTYYIYDYEDAMNKTAFNYFNSNEISKIAEPPVFNEILSITPLYFDKEYLSNHKFNSCFYYGENSLRDDKYKFCMNKFGVKTIIVEKDKLKNNDNFYCESNFLKRISRNIFLEKSINVDYCKLK